MKNTLKGLAFGLVIMFAANAYSQKDLKIGYFSAQEVMQQMPQYDSIDKSLKAYVEGIKTQIKTDEDKLQQQAEEFSSKQDQYTDLIKQKKIKELNNKKMEIDEFKADAQNDIQNRTQESLKYIQDIIKNGVKKVAEKNGYTYIIEESGILWYAKESEDVTDLVLKELGIKK